MWVVSMHVYLAVLCICYIYIYREREIVFLFVVVFVWLVVILVCSIHFSYECSFSVYVMCCWLFRFLSLKTYLCVQCWLHCAGCVLLLACCCCMLLHVVACCCILLLLHVVAAWMFLMKWRDGFSWHGFYR